MKKVIFIRHAKSDWGQSGLPDIKRPLGERGLRDAPIMAKKLRTLERNIDAIISSPAVRAYETAKFFANEFHFKENEIIKENDLYEAFTDDIINVIKAIDPENESVMIFGHNPGWTVFANLFSKDQIDNIPTCGIFRLISSANSWRELGPENTELDLFIRP